MNQLLRTNQIVRTVSSDMPCTVGELLGSGGQGEVYRAMLDHKPAALKWYLPQLATPEQRRNLETLIKTGSPSEKFLWPLELTIAEGTPGFGYIMPLRDARYRGLDDLMKRRIHPPFRTLATAGFGLADSFMQLHTKGFCYCDISFGNVFFDPTIGDVLICDNDNVIVNGEQPLIDGTIRFMAPEVLRGEAHPSRQTDLFSLAVLLFYMFMLHHPLEGKQETTIHCFDLQAMKHLYGTKPVFIFDPHDHSNEPDPLYHGNALDFWPIYPQFLRDLFTQAFTTGIDDPQHGRVQEGVWRPTMVQLHDSIMYCQHCEAENFYDVETLQHSGGKPAPCWSCDHEIRLPARIRLGRNIVMLNHDTQLFPHHVDDQKLYDFSQPVAAVTRHPTDPRIWGLKNLSSEKWLWKTADGQMRDVEPGRSVTIAVGTTIHFGRMEGEIRL